MTSIGQNNRNNIGFSAVTLDKSLAKLGPKFAVELYAAFPKIEKYSKGVNVTLSASDSEYKGLQNFDVYVETIKTVAPIPGSFGTNGRRKGGNSHTGSSYSHTSDTDKDYYLILADKIIDQVKVDKIVDRVRVDKIVDQVRVGVKTAKHTLRWVFDFKYGKPLCYNRTRAREARKATNLAKNQIA